MRGLFPSSLSEPLFTDTYRKSPNVAAKILEDFKRANNPPQPKIPGEYNQRRGLIQSIPLRMKYVDEMGKKKVLGSETEFALSWAKLRGEFHKELTVRAGGDRIFFRQNRQYLGS